MVKKQLPSCFLEKKKKEKRREIWLLYKDNLGYRKETYWWGKQKIHLHFTSLQSLSRVQLLRPHELQHARPPCLSPTPGVHSDSRPSSQWCHPAISPSVVPFSSCLQSLPASESFPMSQLFAWGGQSIGVSALASWTERAARAAELQLCAQAR